MSRLVNASVKTTSLVSSLALRPHVHCASTDGMEEDARFCVLAISEARVIGLRVSAFAIRRPKKASGQVTTATDVLMVILAGTANVGMCVSQS